VVQVDELALKYGCNPYQKPARVYRESGNLPIKIHNGQPGYINLLDAFNGWQLVRELKEASGLPAAASFKHVSPAGAAVGTPLDEITTRACRVEGHALTPLASAYARARGADRMSSYGDFISLSDPCDTETARLIQREVSDGVIAPGFEPGALEILKKKRKGSYPVLEIDPEYAPGRDETKTVFGVTFEQQRNNILINNDVLSNVLTAKKEIPPDKARDLIIALITLKYTQSNSVCFVLDGQTIGVGAGQQSRIHCVRLAGDKADNWYLRRHPQTLELPFLAGVGRLERDNITDAYVTGEAWEVFGGDNWDKYFTARPDGLAERDKRDWLSGMTGVSLGSDAFFPFEDNIQRAAKSGVIYIAQPGGSIRDKQVIETCDSYGMVMAFTGIRLFHH